MSSNNSHYSQLSEKWTGRHRDLKARLWEKHKDALEWASNNLGVKQLVATSLGGILLLSSPHVSLLPKPPLLLANVAYVSNDLDKETRLMLDLKGKIPSEVRPLFEDEEESITEVLTRDFGFTVNAQIQGKRLNRNYGYVGAEQHLPLYPGDTIYTHFENQKEFEKFSSSSMTTGVGAWRYFTSSKAALAKEDLLKEKYYIAVQTFLSPGFEERVKEYRDFFKYRKVLVVNPQNGKAIIADIADAGPSPWTGKHLGGSPEVMSYLNCFDGSQKGAVLYFFIGDDTVPLGPVAIQ